MSGRLINPKSGDKILPWAERVVDGFKQMQPVNGTQMGNGIAVGKDERSKDHRRNLKVVYQRPAPGSEYGIQELLVYGGWWETQDGKIYGLTDGTTKTSYFDFVTVDWAGKSNGTFYLLISRGATNCTLHVEEVGNFVDTYETYRILATFTLDGNGAISSQLQENWKGGNIGADLRLDGISLDKNSESLAQIFNWDGAGQSVPDSVDLFPYKNEAGGGNLLYATAEDIAGQINWDTVDWEAFWDGLFWDDAGSGKIPHDLLWFRDASPAVAGIAGQEKSHDDRYPVRGYDYISWVAQSIGYGAGEDPGSVLQIDLENGQLQREDGTAKHLDWHTGELFATDGTTSHLDWLNRELDKVWTGTDTTTASILGTGALVLDGGMYAAKGVAASGGASWAGGIFQNGDFQVALASTTLAASFVNGLITSAAMATATHALSGTGRIETDGASQYYLGGNKGATQASPAVRLPLVDGTFKTVYLRGGILTET